MGNDSMKDLLQRFKETSHQQQQQQQQQQQPLVESEKDEEGELNLGLSLGGVFGVKPNKDSNGGSTSLFRSASTSQACFSAAFVKEEVEDVPLTRTSSLPSEPLGDTRKRKGLLLIDEEERSFKPNWGFDRPAGIPSLRSARGSIGSQGSGSSGILCFDHLSAQGSSNLHGSRSPASVLPLPEPLEQKPIIRSFSEPARRTGPLEKPKVINSCTEESEAKVMEDMPCVFTKGVGPNGKRIEGLLFKYKNGEDVRIVCVCHGTFLTPAEFVKHAGGGEVAHPLRHIVVSPSPSSFITSSKQEGR